MIVKVYWTEETIDQEGFTAINDHSKVFCIPQKDVENMFRGVFNSDKQTVVDWYFFVRGLYANCKNIHQKILFKGV